MFPATVAEVYSELIDFAYNFYDSLKIMEIKWMENGVIIAESW